MCCATDDVHEIVRNVWDCVLGLPIEPVSEGEWRDDKQLLGAISISGEWTGVVVLQASHGAALKAARRMLADDDHAVSEEDVCDVLAELTNIVGGNIKSLVPGPSSLALPCVSAGDRVDLRLANSLLVCESHFLSEGNPVRVKIWEKDTAGEAGRHDPGH